MFVVMDSGIVREVAQAVRAAIPKRNISRRREAVRSVLSDSVMLISQVRFPGPGGVIRDERIIACFKSGAGEIRYRSMIKGSHYTEWTESGTLFGEPAEVVYRTGRDDGKGVDWSRCMAGVRFVTDGKARLTGPGLDTPAVATLPEQMEVKGI